MSEDADPRTRESTLVERIAGLEQRLARIETTLGLIPNGVVETQPESPVAAAPPVHVRTEQELEFEVGQNWFALTGIVVLTVGTGFLLSLPFANLPAVAPPLAGYITVAATFALAQKWRDSFALIACYLRGAAMALLLCATLRWFFPANHHLIAIDSVAGRVLLILIVGFNLVIAQRWKSPWLTGLALLTGCAVVLVAGSGWFGLSALVLLAAFAIAASHRRGWRALTLAAIPVTYATYLAWALGSPFFGTALHFTTSPALAPDAVLACVVILAAGAWLRPTAEPERAWESISALLNCCLGYGLFFVHTAAAFPSGIALSNAVAFVVFLAISVLFWVRRLSRAATFFYAMTGYAALSVAILKASSAPAVFVWLSVQSVVVVATAIWFRSRFIVVANFSIYVAIVLVYALMVERETGISIGFGLVALVSARILNWQQHRLELKTELMRNAYLLSAFLVFPYALYHLVPTRLVGFAWVGLALGYYALNLLVQNQKYRWMGHATLLLTTCYLVIVGTSQFEPVYRVLSFLVLGTVLIIVSFVFTRLGQNQLK